MLHNPPCESWELHVERAYAALKDGDDYDLIGFVEFLRDTYDEERLSADVAAGEYPFGSAQEQDNHPRLRGVA